MRCATKMNFLLFVVSRDLSEVLTREPLSQKSVGGGTRLECYMQRKSRFLLWFEVVEPLKDVLCN